MKRPEEGSAVRSQMFENGDFARIAIDAALLRRGKQRADVVGKVQRDPAIPFAERLHAGPDHFAGGHDSVEIAWIVEVEAGRQDLGFEDRGRQRRALQLFDDVEQGIGTPAPFDQPLPGRDEAAERRVIDRLDLLAQP